MVYITYFCASDSKRNRADENALGRELLFALYRKLYEKDPPSIKKAPLGKPYFEGIGEPQFNISHSGDAIAVVLSDAPYPVGIDVQASIEPYRAERVSKRFPFAKPRFLEPVSEYAFFKAESFGGEFSFKRETVAPTGTEDFTDAWTLTEALLKADGGGFTSSKELDEIEKRSKALCFKIDGFSISVAEKSGFC